MCGPAGSIRSQVLALRWISPELLTDPPHP